MIRKPSVAVLLLISPLLGVPRFAAPIAAAPWFLVSPAAPGGELTLSGDLEASFDDLSWTVVEYVPPPSVDVDGFVLSLYDRQSGRFKDVLTVSGIPFDTAVGTPVSLGPEVDSETANAVYLVNAMDRSAGHFVAVSGTLTLTMYDAKLSGTIDAQMVPADSGGRPVAGAEPSLHVTASFHDLGAIHPR